MVAPRQPQGRLLRHTAAQKVGKTWAIDAASVAALKAKREEGTL